MAETRATSPRWVRILLVVSLGLNLLVIGGFAGAMLKGGPPGLHEAGRGGPWPAGLRLYARGFDTSDRAAMRDEIRTRRSELRAGRQALRAHLEELGRLLRAETLDKDALRASFAAQRKAGDAQIGLGQELLIQRLEEMTPAERQAYADRLEAALKRRARRSGG